MLDPLSVPLQEAKRYPADMLTNTNLLNIASDENAAVAEAVDSQQQILIGLSPSQCTIRPPSGRDFWRRTFYKPSHVADDAPAVLCPIPASTDVTISCKMILTALRQFDQGGLMLRIDEEHWIKAGLEFVDGVMRLSCVVTNGFSDWSTQPYTTTTGSNSNSPQKEAVDATSGSGTPTKGEAPAAKEASSCEIFLRLHRMMDGSVVFEAGPSESKLSMVRITQLRTSEQQREQQWYCGPFAASPTKQGKSSFFFVKRSSCCEAKFEDFEIGPLKTLCHAVDLSS